MISRNLKAKIDSSAKTSKAKEKLTEEAEKLQGSGMTDESIWDEISGPTQRNLKADD